jgi:hypothetical protein
MSNQRIAGENEIEDLAADPLDPAHARAMIRPPAVSADNPEMAYPAQTSRATDSDSFQSRQGRR